MRRNATTVTDERARNPSIAAYHPRVSMPEPIRKFIRGLNLRGVGHLLIMGIVIGVVAGLGAIAFSYACSAASHFFLDVAAGYRPAVPSGEDEYFEHSDTAFSLWLLPVVAAIGGLLSGVVVYWFAREAKGHGTDSAIDAYHNREGHVPLRVSLVKIVASALTIGSGGSGGREGPIAQIGAGFGSYLASLFRLSARERRIMLASGMGAGVGSIFHAPLAGALFAAEIMYSDAEFESDALIPAAVSTIVAYCVFCLHSGFGPLFETPDLALHSVWELVPYTVLALCVTVASGLFVVVFYGIHDFCERVRMPAPVKPMIGGAITGLLGVAMFLSLDRDTRILDVLSFGYGTLQEAMLGEVGIALLLMLAVGKMVTTSISIGSGGSGGVFGPSMVIGGCTGGVVGALAHRMVPEVVAQPGAYVVVGMAGFFAAAGKVPISTLVMVSEMTGSYALLMPALWVSALAFLFSRNWNLYRSQVRSRIESPAHQHEMFVDVLTGMRVADLEGEREFETVRETAPIDEIVRVFARTTQHYFPVVDDEDRLTGILSANDVRQVIEETSAGSIVIATDIARSDVVTLRVEDDLDFALQRFISLDVDTLPVVDGDAPDRVVAMLSRRDLILAYNAAREAWRANLQS